MRLPSNTSVSLSSLPCLPVSQGGCQDHELPRSQEEGGSYAPDPTTQSLRPCSHVPRLPLVDRFLVDGTLPFDVNNIPANLKPAPIGMWIFDGRGSSQHSMPEIELNPLPDLERNKAIVVIDFGIPDYLCMIPPGLCRLVPTGPNRGRLEPTFGNLS
ncbi:hypothetical protein KCU71_g5147, partial [Aureobasidium melanogenum]